MSKKQTIVFDFDGVIHKYSKGWCDGSIYDEANLDVIDIMYKLMTMGYSVAIVSTRHPIQISEWWNKQDFPVKADPVINDTPFWNNTKYVGIFNRKIPAMVYVDDRGYKFDANKIDTLLDEICNFKTWQESGGKDETDTSTIERIGNLSLSYKTFIGLKADKYDLEIRLWCHDTSSREYCWTLASFEYIEDSSCYELQFCGARANDIFIDWKVFGQLVHKAYEILNTDPRVHLDD